MKLIYVGDLKKTPDRDWGWVHAFSELGWKVTSYSSAPKYSPSILGRVMRRMHWGEPARLVESGLLDLISDIKPDWVHFRLPVSFSKKTISQITAKKIIVTNYFNDDPFSPKALRFYFRRYKKALPEYDGHFVFREHNVNEYINYGARYVEHTGPTYDPAKHIYQPNQIGDFITDVAFIGHWENDWRIECLEALHDAGFSITLAGGLWDRAVMKSKLSYLAPIRPIFGAAYGETYANVMAGLCFFSKINRDTWSRRALEIVAVGGVLVCERTNEAQAHFIEGKEALMFSSVDELVKQVAHLKRDPQLRMSIQQAGYTRLLQGKNTLLDRAIRMDQFVKRLMQKNGLHQRCLG